MLLHILLDYTRRNFNYKSTCIYQMIDVIKYLNQYFNLFAFEDRVVVNFKDDNPVIVERISHIINYVYENYANRITLEDLAEKEHLSTYYLSHLIHEYMGISFQKFLWKQIKKSVRCQEPLVFLLLLITKNFSGNGSGTVRRNIGICFKITF